MKRSMVNGQWAMVKLLLLLFAFQFSFFGVAQKVSTLVNKEKIVLGEQVQVQIKVEGIAGGEIEKDLSFPDTINHIEILSHTIDTIDNSTFLHKLVLTSFDSGYWQFPSFNIVLNNKKKYSTEPFSISVLPVDVSQMQDYHDIKDIQQVPLENNWWVIASIVTLTLISLFGVLWFLQGRTAQPSVVKKTDSLEKQYQNIIERLTELEKKDLSDKTEVRKVYAELYNAIRSFSDTAWMGNTAHLTTGEYMLKTRSKLNAELETKYFQFLRLADAVKFAKYIPGEDEIKAMFPTLRNIVESIYQQIKTAAIA
jgi:hypothetical protein